MNRVGAGCVGNARFRNVPGGTVESEILADCCQECVGYIFLILQNEGHVVWNKYYAQGWSRVREGRESGWGLQEQQNIQIRVTCTAVVLHTT